MSPKVEIDRDACKCNDEPLLVYERADWKPGTPTGIYCNACGYIFGFIDEGEP